MKKYSPPKNVTVMTGIGVEIEAKLVSYNDNGIVFYDPATYKDKKVFVPYSNIAAIIEREEVNIKEPMVKEWQQQPNPEEFLLTMSDDTERLITVTASFMDRYRDGFLGMTYQQIKDGL